MRLARWPWWAAVWVLTFGQAFAEMPADSKHHSNQGFVNPYAQQDHPGFWGFMRARFASGPWAKYDPKQYQIPRATPSVLASGDTDDNAVVTWLGHSTVLIQHRGMNVLTDPMLTPRASPVGFVGPRRISAPALELDELPTIDVVVISHDHYDHLDKTTLRHLGDQTRYFVPLGLKHWLVQQGVDESRVTQMDWWDTAEIEHDGEKLRITATPSQHFSGRGAFDRGRSLWASWMIEWSDFATWFGGDTGYNAVQFAQIGRHFPRIDLGIIPIGAYAPSWFMQAVHVNPEEAVKIHQDIGAAQSMGVHWGTFVLSAEPVDEPVQRLARATQMAGLAPSRFTAFAIGETRRYKRTTAVRR